MKKFIKDTWPFILGCIMGLAILYVGKLTGYKQGYAKGYDKCIADFRDYVDSAHVTEFPNHSEIKPKKK